MKRTTIKRFSPERRKQAQDWNRLVTHLIENRAGRQCEIRATEPCQDRNFASPNFPGLSGHHIIKRSQGGPDTAGNCLIGCPDCHAHSKYGTGTPLSQEEQLELVQRLNTEYGISGELHGSHL